jgi:hypothetical protein
MYHERNTINFIRKTSGKKTNWEKEKQKDTIKEDLREIEFAGANSLQPVQDKSNGRPL